MRVLLLPDLFIQHFYIVYLMIAQTRIELYEFE